jgi:hypothetical protein
VTRLTLRRTATAVRRLLLSSPAELSGFGPSRGLLLVPSPVHLTLGGLRVRHAVPVQFGYQLSICSRAEEDDGNLDRGGRSQDLPDASGCAVSNTSPYPSSCRSHVTTDGQSAHMSRCRAHSGTCDFCPKVVVWSLWGALSDERLGVICLLISCNNVIIYF